MDYTLNKEFQLSKEQNEIIDFMIRRPQAVCGAQTGIGKTLCLTTAAIHLLRKFPELHAVFIVPQKAVKVFKKELGRLHMDYNIISSSTKSFSLNKRMTIITHTMLEKHRQEITDLRAKYKLLGLIDESHALQEPTGEFYKIMYRMRPLFAVLWGATATPLKNDITGLYWMINLFKPEYLGSIMSFKYRYLIIKTFTVHQKIIRGGVPFYMDRTEEEIVGFKNMEELKGLLDNIIILRQKKYDLEFHYHKTDLTTEETNYYLMAGKGIFLDKEVKDNWAVRVHQLQRVVDNIHENYMTDKNKLSSKEKLFMRLLQEKMKEDAPCLVYFDYTDTLERIKYIIECTRRVTGVNNIYIVSAKIDTKKREEVEEKISKNDVVLVTLAGTESINLQRANSVIFYDIPFAIQTFIQMVGRVTRVDSKFQKQHIHFIEAFGTSDTYRRMLIQIHGELIRTLFGDIATLPLEVSSIDRKTVKQLKNALLWSFKNGKLATEEQLNKIVDLDDEDIL